MCINKSLNQGSLNRKNNRKKTDLISDRVSFFQKPEHLTLSNCSAVGRSSGDLARHELTNSLKKSDHSPPASVGESFWAIWYKALMAFILNNGGFLSAESKNKIRAYYGGLKYGFWFLTLFFIFKYVALLKACKELLTVSP